MPTETDIETELQAKGLDAPRLTPDMIDACIVGEDFHVFPGTTLTVCCLHLRNGFTVTGESASASPENFDRQIGQKIARDNARQKIWALEGYLLRDRLARQNTGGE
ncbi:MAG: Gp49 family protein [Pseudomonadota bacterium]